MLLGQVRLFHDYSDETMGIWMGVKNRCVHHESKNYSRGFAKRASASGTPSPQGSARASLGCGMMALCPISVPRQIRIVTTAAVAA